MAKESTGNASPTRTAHDGDREKRIRDRRNARGTGLTADWGGVNGKSLARAIAAITKHGYACLLGYTTDQGAYTIRIVGIENIKPDYIRPTEDVDGYLDNLAEDFEAL